MTDHSQSRGFDLRNDWFLAAFWPVLGAIATAIQTISRATQGNAVDWARVAAAFMPWIGWSLLTPIIVTIARRSPIAGTGRKGSAVALHLFALLAMAALHSSFVYATRYAIVGSLVPDNVTLVRDLSQRLPVHLMFDVLVYISTLLAVYTMDTGLRYQDDATRTAQLEAEVARSELAVMTAQVQPQFVLSTLNAVRRLLPANPGKAEVVVSRLSEILRITLENVSSEEVRLIDELEFLRRFFEIEQHRHSGTVDFDTSGDGDLLDAYVPNLLLQDLAVAWVGHSDPTASVSIRADVARRDGRLFLRFEVTRQDSAPTVPDDAVVERAKRRLQRFAADDWELRVTRDKGSVAIDMTMPERFASHDEGHDSEHFDGGSFARLG